MQNEIITEKLAFQAALQFALSEYVYLMFLVNAEADPRLSVALNQGLKKARQFLDVMDMLSDNPQKKKDHK
jgi:hypothetical protein